MHKQAIFSDFMFVSFVCRPLLSSCSCRIFIEIHVYLMCLYCNGVFVLFDATVGVVVVVVSAANGSRLDFMEMSNESFSIRAKYFRHSLLDGTRIQSSFISLPMLSFREITMNSA